MSDKPGFAEGSLIQFGLGLVGVAVLCLIGWLLAAVGASGAMIVFIFLFVIVAVAVIRAGTSIHATPMSKSVIASVERLSAFGLFGIVGAVFAFGHDGLAIVIGLAAGFVLSLVLIAPRLAVISARSLPDFLSLRFGSETLRYAAVGILALVTILFVAAQMVAAGLIAVQGLGVSAAVGVVIAIVGVLVLTLPLAGRAGEAGQSALAIIAIVGIAIATVWLLSAKTGVIVPHLAYGGLFSDIAAAEERLGLEAHFGRPSAMLGLGGTAMLILCLAVGSAVMPHSIAQVTVQGSVARTQATLRRALILFVVVATALPALGVLARADLLALFTAAQGILPFDAVPQTLLHGAQVCGGDVSAMVAACTAEAYTGGLPVEELSLDPQAILLALPSLSGASVWMLALLSMVGLAVVIVAASAAVSNLAAIACSRTPESDTGSAASIVVVLATLGAAAFALITNLDIISLGAWSFSLIGAALFAPLVLGLWWPRATAEGAIAGMLGGFAITALYILGASWGFDLTSESGDEWSWLGVPPLMAGAFGIAASMILTFAVSIATKQSRTEQIALITALDAPPAIAVLEAPE